MIVWPIVVLALAVYRVKISLREMSHSYIDLESIQAIKGIFLLLIFASHFAQYVSLAGPLNESYLMFRRFLGQLVVAPFLFYSGYGVAISIQKRRSAYVESMPKRRILKVLVQFDLAILLFLGLDLWQGKTYSLRHILLSLIGWQGVGNSNWYVFAILFLYLATYFSFSAFGDNKYAAPISVTIWAIFFVCFMQTYRDGYWYNTVFCYVAGLWFSFIKPKFEAVCLHSQKSYLLSLLTVIVGFRFLHKYWQNIICYELTAVAFSLAIVLITVKVTIRSRILVYCGEHLFSLFILQRLPMQALKNSWLQDHILLYFCTCFLITFLLSFCFDSAFSVMWKKIEISTDKYSESGVHMVKKFKKYQFLFEELVKRDFKKKYKRTVLGMMWSVLSPLLTLLIMRLVFTQFFGRNVAHYTTYLFCGNLVFSYFNEATSQGMTSLMGNASIFTKVNVPKYLFLFSKNVQTLINFGLTLCVFFVFCILDNITFTWKLICLLYPIACLVLFNIGVGLVLSALFVFFRDIQYLWSVFTQLLMYMSAIFYTIDGYSYKMQCLFLLNPVYLFIRYFRKIVIEATVPTLWFHLLMSADVAIVLGIGCWMYKKYNHRFLYYV